MSTLESYTCLSPLGSRKTLHTFLHPDGSPKSPSKTAKELPFIPYLQERDSMGHLLSKKHRSKVGTSSKDLFPLKHKSFDKTSSIFSFQPEPIQDIDADYAVFKYQPTLPISEVKAMLKNIVKPSSLSLTQQSVLSPCFQAPGRLLPLDKQVPSVGYYEPSDKLLHRSVNEVKIPKERRALGATKFMNSQEIDNIDLVKVYNKIYNRSTVVADFSRQTTRDNHFMNKLPAKNEALKTSIDHHGSSSNIGLKYSNSIKDMIQEVPLKAQQLNLLEARNFPLSTGALHDKFRQVKTKYNIYSAKLK